MAGDPAFGEEPVMSSRPSRCRRLALAAALLTLLGAAPGGEAAAGEVVLFQSRVPSKAELAFLLWPPSAKPAPTRRTRSLWARDNLDLGPAHDVVPASIEEEAEEARGFAFMIRFAFASTEILPESRQFLDRVGELMASEQAAGRRLTIVGHADASGPDGYNQRLSEARAKAVRGYLMAWYGVPAEQLAAEGKGERAPRAGTDPFDPTNRRVEFLAAN
jgi:outer membrane protein OmpA-like peptidoglycan-associated protein